MTAPSNALGSLHIHAIRGVTRIIGALSLHPIHFCFRTPHVQRFLLRVENFCFTWIVCLLCGSGVWDYLSGVSHNIRSSNDEGSSKSPQFGHRTVWTNGHSENSVSFPCYILSRRDKLDKTAPFQILCCCTVNMAFDSSVVRTVNTSLLILVLLGVYVLQRVRELSNAQQLSATCD